MGRVDDGTAKPTPAGSSDVHGPAAVQSLREAMRRARADDAERSSVLGDLRGARIARLDVLKDALDPLLAQIPPDVDLFDVAVMPGATPRLFIDMIAFVEMGRDARLYRFIQDTRYGRMTIAESTDVARLVAAITDYVARRLLERDKALATDDLGTVMPAAAPAPARRTPAPRAPSARRGLLAWTGIAFAFLIDLLGSIAFFSILAGLAWVLWNKYHGHV